MIFTRDRRGFTIMELTMAIVIVGLASAAMAQLLDATRRAARDDARMRLAGEVMEGAVERVRARDVAEGGAPLALPAVADALPDAGLEVARDEWRGGSGMSRVTLTLTWSSARGGTNTMRRILLLRDGGLR